MQGVVKSWNGEKGYGFISCDMLTGDVMFSRNDLPIDIKEVRGKFLDGRPVVFDAQQGPDGRYKATSMVVPYVEGKSLAGQIKIFFNEKGFGFITSSSLTEDVFFPANILNGVSPGTQLKGELVMFDVEAQPDGKLKATKVLFQSGKIATRVKGTVGNMMMPNMPSSFSAGGKPSNMSMGLGGNIAAMNVMNMGSMQNSLGSVQARVEAAAAKAQAQGLIVGSVKSYSERNGYGFLQIPGLPNDMKFGRQSLVGVQNVSQGEMVSFRVEQLPDGRMQAVQVSSLMAESMGMQVAQQPTAKRPASEMGNGMPGMGMLMPMQKMQKAKPSEKPTGQFNSGIIRSYNGQKGFGFISSPSISGDIFFMLTSLPQEARDLHGKDLQGKAVNFEVSQTPDGKVRAQNIVIT